MRRTVLFVAALAVITVAQQLTPPAGPFTNDEFVNTLAGKLGMSTDDVRTALRSSVVQPPDGGPITSQSTAPVGADGRVVTVGVDDGFVNNLSTAFNLEPDTVRKALMETLEEVQPERITVGS